MLSVLWGACCPRCRVEKIDGQLVGTAASHSDRAGVHGPCLKSQFVSRHKPRPAKPGLCYFSLQTNKHKRLLTYIYCFIFPSQTSHLWPPNSVFLSFPLLLHLPSPTAHKHWQQHLAWGWGQQSSGLETLPEWINGNPVCWTMLNHVIHLFRNL